RGRHGAVPQARPQPAAGRDLRGDRAGRRRAAHPLPRLPARRPLSRPPMPSASAQWPPIARLRTARLSLDPLRADDADAMVPVLGDAALYEYTGGEAPSLEQLQRRYAAQVAGPGDDA